MSTRIAVPTFRHLLVFAVVESSRSAAVFPSDGRGRAMPWPRADGVGRLDAMKSGIELKDRIHLNPEFPAPRQRDLAHLRDADRRRAVHPDQAARSANRFGPLLPGSDFDNGSGRLTRLALASGCAVQLRAVLASTI